MRRLRIIIDTNIWISFLISKKHPEIKNLVEDKKIILLFSKELLNEFLEVTARPKFKKYFSSRKTKLLFQVFDEFGIRINTYPSINICRDEKDNFLLDLAVQGNADYLVTGDEGLLILEEIESTKIITLHDFLKVFA